MKPRVAFVIQRYSEETSGGAEAHCRAWAKHMSPHWDVEILTTTSRDYITWANHYPPGTQRCGAITVRRFKTSSRRDKRRFDQVSAKLHANIAHTTMEEQTLWMREQGPCSPGLTAYITEHESDYDAFYFFSHLYATTWDNLPHVARKAILVPLAHDSWVMELPMWETLLHLPLGFVFNTEEERRLLQARFPKLCIDGPVIGTGITRPDHIDPAAFRRHFSIDEDFLLYVGRIEPSKGCDELFERYIDRRRHTTYPERLVLIGDEMMEIPQHPEITSLGFVSETMKWAALAACQCLVMPSRQESLSLAVLEAWSVSKPVLVNGNCDVLVGQCRRSNGGLWYDDKVEFQEVLDYLCNGRYAHVLGRQGRAWFEQRYSWPHITNGLIEAARIWSEP